MRSWSAKCGVRPAPVFCTCTASRLLSAGDKTAHSLDKVPERYLGIQPRPDHSASDWGDLVLTDEQLSYAAADAAHRDLLGALPRSDVAADGLKIALVELATQLPEGPKIISTVHDEVIVEAPARDAETVSDTLHSVMIKAMVGLYPEVPLKSGPTSSPIGGEKDG